MNRRSFFKQTGLGMAAIGLPASKILAEMPETKPFGKPHLTKPPRLREGATVGLIAPASPISDEKYQKAVENLTRLGFVIREGKSLRARNGHLAGADAERLADLHWAFSDPEVEAVWCVRGGYGCTRLLPGVDFGLIRRNAKPFIGYSDVTALHLAIGKKTGLVTFHGPVGASDYTDFTLNHFRRVLMLPSPRHEIALPGEGDILLGDEYRPEIITAGRAEGRLTGGNLSLLAALVGTPFCPSFRGKIVFIEEVGEQPYRVDRLLTQLLQGTDLAQAAGLALGVFADCQPKREEFSLTLSATLRDRLGGLGIPVVYGLPFGHISNQATLPYGTWAELDTEKGRLVLVEMGVGKG